MVLGNKNDLPGALSETELSERFGLKVRRNVIPRGERGRVGEGNLLETPIQLPLCLCCVGHEGPRGLHLQYLMQAADQHQLSAGVAHKARQVLSVGAALRLSSAPL
jgi:hypothetical protein